jgi:hypothetical protein
LFWGPGRAGEGAGGITGSAELFMRKRIKRRKARIRHMRIAFFIKMS